jgi:hypothetical protein
MKNQFVSYEIAKELKKLGFKENCFGVYGNYPEEFVFSIDALKMCEIDDKLTLAPLWQQVFCWFIDEHQLNGIPYYNITGKWDYNIQRVESGLLTGQVTGYLAMRDTYPEILEACIWRLIDKIKERKHEKRN